jgi:hypothetical protein
MSSAAKQLPPPNLPVLGVRAVTPRMGLKDFVVVAHKSTPGFKGFVPPEALQRPF